MSTHAFSVRLLWNDVYGKKCYANYWNCYGLYIVLFLSAVWDTGINAGTDASHIQLFWFGAERLCSKAVILRNLFSFGVAAYQVSAVVDSCCFCSFTRESLHDADYRYSLVWCTTLTCAIQYKEHYFPKRAVQVRLSKGVILPVCFWMRLFPHWRPTITVSHAWT